MKLLIEHERVSLRIGRLIADGADVSGYAVFVRRLCRGKKLGPEFKDHALKGKLKGLRSAVVGYVDDEDPNNCSIVAVYEVNRNAVMVAIVDQHENAYEELRRVKR